MFNKIHGLIGKTKYLDWSDYKKKIDDIDLLLFRHNVAKQSIMNMMTL